MIISHRKRFVFVHNPKAGGTSISNSLREFHDDAFPMFGSITTSGHTINYQHIRAPELERFFPEKYERIKHYAWFGIFRDPVTRFVSSVQNFEKSYGGVEPMFLSEQEIRDMVVLYANRLDASFLERPECIMFWPQSQFLNFPISAQSTKIFRLERPSELVNWISSLTGRPFELRLDNQTLSVQMPSILRSLLTVRAKQRLRRIIPTAALSALLEVLHVAHRRAVDPMTYSPLIIDRLRDFYADDFQMLRRLEAEPVSNVV